jgi:hypothetical protein
MDHLKKLNMVCFDAVELSQLFKDELSTRIIREVVNRGYSSNDLSHDKPKMEEISDIIVSKGMVDKEYIESFIALNSCIVFYSENAKVCFVLKDSFNLDKASIKNWGDLKSATKEDTLTDFAIYWGGGLRQFQLKQYKGKLNTDHIFGFIEKKLKGYCYNLGEVNLMVILQGKGGNISIAEVDFHEISKKIHGLGLKSESEILIKYNEGNKFYVINQLYPELKTCRKKIDQNYLAGELFYKK